MPGASSPTTARLAAARDRQAVGLAEHHIRDRRWRQAQRPPPEPLRAGRNEIVLTTAPNRWGVVLAWVVPFFWVSHVLVPAVRRRFFGAGRLARRNVPFRTTAVTMH
jgi:hypothetical protein